MTTKNRSLAPRTEADVWLRILHPDDEMTPRVARAILGLRFPEDEVARMRVLSAKPHAGSLSYDEDAERDNLERVGSILSTLKSKARKVLKRSTGS
jgi:hypothetical protein